MQGTIELGIGRGVSLATRAGRLVGVDPQGRLLVEYPGNRLGPRPARLAAPGDAAAWRNAAAKRRSVLLLVGRSTRRVPIVVGLLRESLDDPEFDASKGPCALEASGELVLRCGRAVITLREDGKIVIQGLDVISRAARTNKIKGGSVQIN